MHGRRLRVFRPWTATILSGETREQDQPDHVVERSGSQHLLCGPNFSTAPSARAPPRRGFPAAAAGLSSTSALFVVAGGFALVGNRLRIPLRIARPGRTAAGFMIAIWLLAILDVMVATFVYGLQVEQALAR